jgi:hypothetical protein
MDRESSIGEDHAVLSFCLQNGWCFREEDPFVDRESIVVRINAARSGSAMAGFIGFLNRYRRSAGAEGIGLALLRRACVDDIDHASKRQGVLARVTLQISARCARSPRWRPNDALARPPVCGGHAAFAAVHKWDPGPQRWCPVARRCVLRNDDCVVLLQRALHEECGRAL